MSNESWIYIRMSTEEQEDSPVTQGQLTEAFLQQQGAPPWTRTYFDLGKSAKSTEKRMGMLTMITDAERQRPACIVFFRLDRAFRNAEEQAVTLRRLKKVGAAVLKVRDPNLQGPMGDLVDGILGNINQFERQLTGMRIREHNLAMAQRGEWSGGIVPYGYQYRAPVKERGRLKALTITPGAMEPHPAEWPAAQQLWQWALTGYRQAEILELASDRGIRRRNGLPWRFVDLIRLYQSRIYAGYVPFGHHSANTQGEWYLGRHTPIVTLEEWHQVQAKLFQGNRKQRSVRQPLAELSGLIRCRICGSAIGSTGVCRDGGYSYACIAQCTKAVAHQPITRREWLIHLAVQRVLDQSNLRLPTAPPPDDPSNRRAVIEREIKTQEGRMTRLRQLFVLGEYNDDLTAFQREKLAIETQIALRQRELVATGPAADELKGRHTALQNWHAAYEAAGSVVERQRLWRMFVDWAELDAGEVIVHLCDLGPSVPRDWVVRLPPPGTRLPGTRASGRGGIVGQSKCGRSRGWLAQHTIEAEPLAPAAQPR